MTGILSPALYNTLENEPYGEYAVISQIRKDVASALENSCIYTEARAYMGMLLSTVYATMMLAAKESERHFGTVYAVLSEAHDYDTLDILFNGIVDDENEHLALADFLKFNWVMFNQFPVPESIWRDSWIVRDRLKELAPVCTYVLSNYMAGIED